MSQRLRFGRLDLLISHVVGAVDLGVNRGRGGSGVYRFPYAVEALQVQRGHMRDVLEGHSCCNQVTPVAAVDGVPPVPQAGHQLHPHTRDTVVAVAPLAWLSREAV